MIKSPLFTEIRNYLFNVKENEQIILYVPFIKIKILAKLVENISNQITIITTWNTNDLITGSSDLELYQWCQENKNFLYVHDKIHLKVYSVNLDSAIITSANISHKGLEDDGNYEIGVFVEKLTNQDRMYLEKIKKGSYFVDDDIYKQYLENYEKCKKNTPEKIKFKQPTIIPKKDYFLKSSLPMTRDVDNLIDGYLKINNGLEPSNNSEIVACIYHDLANYNIDIGLSEEEFIEKLKTKFFSHPFTKKIDEFINPEAYFGRIKEWVQENCTDVPLPKRWELTENVQALYDWFEKLGDGKYIVDVPGQHSQRIRKIPTASISKYHNKEKLDETILKIIGSTGYTIYEIEKKYANIEHKTTNLDVPSNSSELENKSKSIWHYKIEINKKIEEIESLNKTLDDNEKEKIYKNIAYVIGRLEKEEYLSFWVHKNKQYSPGIWRLTEKGKQKLQKLNSNFR